MIKPIDSFGSVFCQKSCEAIGLGRMAIVAMSNALVGGFHPSAKLVLHHVALSTGHGVIGEIGVALSIIKGKGAESNPHSSQNKNSGKEEFDAGDARFFSHEFVIPSMISRGVHDVTRCHFRSIGFQRYTLYLKTSWIFTKRHE